MVDDIGRPRGDDSKFDKIRFDKQTTNVPVLERSTVILDTMAMENRTLNCTIVSEELVVCNGTEYALPERVLTYNDQWFWIYIGIYTGLVLVAGEILIRFNQRIPLVLPRSTVSPELLHLGCHCKQ